MFGYVGLGPGQEFIPYFFALLGFVGAALIAILQWPFLALYRRIAKAKKRPQDEATAGATRENTSELVDEAHRDRS